MAASAENERPHGDVETQTQQGRVSLDKKDSKVFVADKDGHELDSTDEIKQDGVKQVEALTKVWNRTAMWSIFALLYLIIFVDTLFQAVTSSLEAYITSEFGQHGLLSIVGVISSIAAGSSKLAIAKIIDIRGRCEGYIYMIVLILVGILMKATCQNIETYVAGQTFYWVGHLGLTYIIDVLVSDMTTLRNRMIVWGLLMSPRIASIFSGGKIGELFNEHSNFRWAFGTFMILVFFLSICQIFRPVSSSPVFNTIPVVGTLTYYDRKARKLGVLEEKPKRTVWESVKYYVIEFDVIGIFLVIAGFSILLIPFNIYNRAPDGWKSDYIIAMIVLGFFLLVAFVAWERFYAKVPFIPFHFLMDRTILGACLLDAFMWMTVFCWDTYYQSYLQVVHGLSIYRANLVLNAYSLTSTILSPFVGVAIRYTRNYYWFGVSGVVIHFIGTGVVYAVRHSGSTIASLVVGQCIIGWAGAHLICTSLALMANVEHNQIAAVLAIDGLIGSIGRSIGLSIAGAIWNGELQGAITKHLPDDAKDQAAAIYGDIKLQLKYPFGNPIRDGVIEAYSEVQRQLCIAALAIVPFMLFSVLMWRNKPLVDKKTNGIVF